MTRRIERQLLFCLVCVFFSTSSPLYASEEIETRRLREDMVAEFATRLRDRDFDAAMTMLSNPLQDRIGEHGLKSMVVESESHFGKLIDRGSFRIERLVDVWVYKGRTKWENLSRLPLWVSFDETNLIDGLWLDGSHVATSVGFSQHGISAGRLEHFANEAIHTITASVVLPNGQPVRKSSVAFWKSVSCNDVPEEKRSSLWIEAESEHCWQRIAGAATGSQMSAYNLTPGSYRVTAREGHNDTGSVGISSITTIDAKDLAVEIVIELERGETVTINPIDIDTQAPSPRPSVILKSIGGRYPNWTFRPKHSEHLPIQFDSLMPGKYEITARRRSSSVDGLQYGMLDEEQVLEVVAGEATNIDLLLKARLLSDEEVNARWGWTAFGRVIDEANKPLPDAEVRVATGWGTLLGGATTKTNSQGEFRLRFAEGVLVRDPTGRNTQAAVFSASLTGYSVKKATKPMRTVMARKLPMIDDRFAHQPDEIPLRGKPFRIDFVMARNTEQEVSQTR